MTISSSNNRLRLQQINNDSMTIVYTHIHRHNLLSGYTVSSISCRILLARVVTQHSSRYSSLTSTELLKTAPLAAHRMANPVQTCLLNLQSITHRSSAIPRRPIHNFTSPQGPRAHLPVTYWLSDPHHNLLFGSHVFRTSAPQIWNSLPPYIQQSQTLSSFSHHLN